MDPSFDPVAFAGSRRRISPTRTDVATISTFMTLPPFLGARPRPCDISLDLMDDIIIVNYITQAGGGVWQGVNVCTGSAASAIWAERPAWDHNRRDVVREPGGLGGGAPARTLQERRR
jgi:hypothetical protein